MYSKDHQSLPARSTSKIPIQSTSTHLQKTSEFSALNNNIYNNDSEEVRDDLNRRFEYSLESSNSIISKLNHSRNQSPINDQIKLKKFEADQRLNWNANYNPVDYNGKPDGSGKDLTGKAPKVLLPSPSPRNPSRSASLDYINEVETDENENREEGSTSQRNPNYTNLEKRVVSWIEGMNK